MERGNITHTQTQTHNVFVNCETKDRLLLDFFPPVFKFNPAYHSFRPPFFSNIFYSYFYLEVRRGGQSRNNAEGSRTSNPRVDTLRKTRRETKLAGFTVFLSIFFLSAGRGYTGRKERENEGNGEGTKLDMDKGVRERRDNGPSNVGMRA